MKKNSKLLSKNQIHTLIYHLNEDKRLLIEYRNGHIDLDDFLRGIRYIDNILTREFLVRYATFLATILRFYDNDKYLSS